MKKLNKWKYCFYSVLIEHRKCKITELKIGSILNRSVEKELQWNVQCCFKETKKKF